MEMDGQLHSPVALPPEKYPQVPLGWEAEKASDPVCGGK
jgi:hypothetical protein